MARTIANSIGIFQTAPAAAGSSRPPFGASQAVLAAETANFDDYGHNNTTMGKIIYFNLTKD